jgi:hypothetical protein
MHLSAFWKADKCMMKSSLTYISIHIFHVLYGKISSCIYLPFEKQINAWWNLHLHTFQSIYFMSCMGRFQSQYFIHVLYGKTFQSQYFMSCMGRFHQHDEILPQWVLTNISNHNHTPSYYYSIINHNWILQNNELRNQLWILLYVFCGNVLHLLNYYANWSN